MFIKNIRIKWYNACRPKSSRGVLQCGSSLKTTGEIPATLKSVILFAGLSTIHLSAFCLQKVFKGPKMFDQEAVNDAKYVVGLKAFQSHVGKQS